MVKVDRVLKIIEVPLHYTVRLATYRKLVAQGWLVLRTSKP